ncbi:MAG: bifunctional 5,10-methylenetetrahydrofolate dehydrogenase/5,10-methenyltetrahydrofolate cyclohydrolase [Candidatus Helarchaeota archaeon]|nr:bifunctional 5,10-methylenetetrahydrofolate dehydrogenase/5,10-methenyltetrahydrofolate cyclohydrolase [Candidatus Helarchaeota archaeon]
MSEKILDGKKVANLIEKQVKDEVDSLIQETSVTPGLSTILVGENPGSKIYVNIKKKACNRVGINSELINLSDNLKEQELLAKIEELNDNPAIHGILVQLPLPPHIQLLNVFSAINPKKDVDCLHPINFGKLVIGKEDLVPCTPKGIVHLLEHYEIPITEQDTVIVNHSTILGKPLALMFLNRDATVSVAHIKTKNLKMVTKTADILIVGAGSPNLIKNDMIKENCVIVDAGISRIEGKIVGDVDFEGVLDKVRAITPVPGGVGPMTVACLLQNTIICYKNLSS